MVSGELTPDKVAENDELLAFRDIAPQAPTHILIIPKRHIATINDVNPEDGALLGKMIVMAKEIAAGEGLAENGYRLIFNCNGDGGQAVYHIHLHLLGGRAMSWPPG
jgi:histidine triad (HIT) family protein